MFDAGATFDFGAAASGGSFEATLTLANLGGFIATDLAAAAPGLPFAFKGGGYPGTGGTCASELVVGARCRMVVTFAPPANGSFSAPLDLNFNDGSSPRVAQLQMNGTGAAPAVLTSSDPSGYDFGPVTTNLTRTYAVTVTNTGGARATGLAPTLAPSAPFGLAGGFYPGTGGTCAATLDPAASCTVVISFSPTTGTASSDALTLRYFDGLNDQLNATSLTGTGVTPAALSFVPGTTYDFGSVANGGTVAHSFTVTNSGQATAASVGATVSGTTYAFSGGTYPGGGTCGATVAGGASCTISVSFQPTTFTTTTGTLALTYTGGAASRALTGTGALPATLVLSDGPGSYDFGGVYVGASGFHSLVVSNPGGVAATISSVVTSAPFPLNGGAYPGTNGTCGTTLAASASCVLDASFAPSSAGAASGSFVVNYHNGVGNTSSSRGVTGTGLASTPPAAFGPLAYGLPDFAQVNVSWASAGGTPAATYDVARATAPGGPWSTLASNLTPTNYFDNTVSGGTRYYFRVTAHNVAGTVTTTDSTGVVPLGAFNITAGIPGSGSATVDWGPSAGADSYRVSYGTAANTYGTVASSNATAPLTVTGLTPGTQYHFRVYAINATSSGLPSAAEYVVTPNP